MARHQRSLSRLPHPEQRVGGYIVDGPVSAPRLVFYDKGGTKAVYVARFAANRLTDARLLGESDEIPLSAVDLRMIAARASAGRALAADKTVFACTAKPFNTVTLPPDSMTALIAVYFLTPQTSNDAIPFGGHFEVDVDTSGHAGAVRRFSNTCIAAPTHPKLPGGGKPTMFSIASVLDPAPTEIHVFSSLALRLPVGVITGTSSPRVWPVVGATISEPVEIKR